MVRSRPRAAKASSQRVLALTTGAALAALAGSWAALFWKTAA